MNKFILTSSGYAFVSAWLILSGMSYYQQILESLFYYFKKSPERCDKMEAVQKVLNEPQLKYREVHEASLFFSLLSFNIIKLL